MAFLGGPYFSALKVVYLLNPRGVTNLNLLLQEREFLGNMLVYRCISIYYEGVLLKTDRQEHQDHQGKLLW